jgi:hypothetical protein
MTTINFKAKSIEELWALHEEIASILSAKMEAEKLKLEQRLQQIEKKGSEALFPVDRSRSDIDVVELKRGTTLLLRYRARVMESNASLMLIAAKLKLTLGGVVSRVGKLKLRREKRVRSETPRKLRTQISPIMKMRIPARRRNILAGPKLMAKGSRRRRNG